jgi:D-amino-acid dehydrogenase
MGHRPSLPDSLPVIGPSSRHPSVFYAFGHHHVGLTAAPMTGRLIAELVSGTQPSLDLSVFRIDRF